MIESLKCKGHRVGSRWQIDDAEQAGKSWATVERLGYTPNAAATNLRTLRTKKLLVTVPDISNPFFSIESGAVAGERLLGRNNPPKAIFCFNDVAMGVPEIARRRKLRVPEHVSIVGFDDIRFAAYVDPPLTTIVQPMRQIGEGTVRLLLETLQGGGPPESVTLPHVLVVRWSTGPPAGL